MEGIEINRNKLHVLRNMAMNHTISLSSRKNTNYFNLLGADSEAF